MYCIRIDKQAAVIEVEVCGFWSTEQVDALAADLRVAIPVVTATGRRHCVLYDYSTAVIQSQTVVAALQTLARHFDMPARRIALFTGGRLARLQAGRIAAVRDDMRLFDDRAAAMAWLSEPEPQTDDGALAAVQPAVAP